MLWGINASIIFFHIFASSLCLYLKARMLGLNISIIMGWNFSYKNLYSKNFHLLTTPCFISRLKDEQRNGERSAVNLPFNQSSKCISPCFILFFLPSESDLMMHASISLLLRLHAMCTYSKLEIEIYLHSSNWLLFVTTMRFLI